MVSSRSDRSPSATSSSSRKYNRRAERPHRYGMKKRSFISRRSSIDDDGFAFRHHKEKFSGQGYGMKCKSSNSKRRARYSASDFEDSYHERTPSKTTRYRSRPGAYFSKRRNSSESDDYRYHKHRKNRHYQSRRASDSRRRRITSSSDSGDSRHRRRLTSVIQKRKFEDSPDIRIMKEQRVKNKCWRSKEKESPVGHSLSKEKESLSMYRLSNVKESSAMYRFYLKSGKYMEEGSLKKALKCINITLNLCKDDDKFLSKSYCRRGDIYSLLEKPRCSFQGFLDWEHAHIIDKDNMEARKRMSKVLFMGANNYYRMKAHKKALALCNHALDLNASNGEAFVLQQLLKKKLLDKMKKLKGLSAKKLIFETRSISEKISNAQSASCSYDKQVYNEIERFSELIKKALVMNNLPRALILVNQASLKLHEASYDDGTKTEVSRKLFVLKQSIMSSVNPDLRAVSEDKIKSALALLP